MRSSWALAALRPFPLGETLFFLSYASKGSLDPIFITPLSGTRPPNHRAREVPALCEFLGHQNKWSAFAPLLYRARNELGSVRCASLASTGPTSSCHLEMAWGPRSAITKTEISAGVCSGSNEIGSGDSFAVKTKTALN